ncbi:MAG: type II toxin-antitoxin system VapC family toxin [Thermomicrobiales bacterium]|nr:type II toxin-antitoxin system VapC family toxin [Thermomicrobiales bacterium]
MIVDTSALLAIAFGEETAARILDVLAEPEIKRVSAANLFEALAVVDRRNDHDAVRSIEESIVRFEMVVESVTSAHVEIAREAWSRFGKGSGHPARLNFGDCFAYALAKERNEPLLFVGNDFVHTDLIAAL